MSFKEFYNKTLCEGGNAGHLSHVFEALTKKELFQFFDKLFKGDLSASEKVDGANLFVGYNKEGKLTFARNITEPPSTKIEEKFPINHPGGDAFRAGFKALQTAFEKLTKEDRIKSGMINVDGTTKAFINLEIIYGEIPNLIQYSSVNNYIVFHNMVGPFETRYAPLNENVKQNQQKGLGLDYKGWGIYQNKQGQSFEWDKRFSKFVQNKKNIVLPTIKERLAFLANKIGQVTISSDVVTYYGEIGSVKRDVKKEQSTWIFKSQIDIPTEKIKSDLEKIANKWKQFPEFKQLQDDTLSTEEEFELKKSLTAKIGHEILINLSSELFKGERKTPENHPKIEGMVIPYDGKLVKITGDFAQLNQDLWAPLRNGFDEIFTTLIQKLCVEQLDIPAIKKLTKASWFAKDVNGDASAFLISKNKKLYKDGNGFDIKINKVRVGQMIVDAQNKLNIGYKKMLADKSNVKKDNIIKAIKIGSYKLQELENSVQNGDGSRVSLMLAIKSILFNL
jgi:hypothetical protein